MDVTPALAQGAQAIDGYRSGGFRIAGKLYDGAVIVHRDRVEAWDGDLQTLQLEDGTRTLLFGGGECAQFPEKDVRQSLRDRGIIIEPMDTPAACRTWNILLSEGREAAVALLPMP